ncbi:HDOD domain-containing protein [bacterium]|nr:HDOD domain-containing protein [bacterium]
MKPGSGDKPDILIVGKSSRFTHKVAKMLNTILECLITERGSFDEALESISGQLPDLILIDSAAQDLSAVEFVKNLHLSGKKQAKIPLVLFHPDKFDPIVLQETQSEVINLVKKPVDEDELYDLLVQLFPQHEKEQDMKSMVRRAKIKEKLKYVNKLVPLPSTVKTIMDIANDPRSSARDLAKEVKKDQSLTGKILKIVNSAYYGFHREIGNVDHAIVVLGFDEVMNITQAACLLQFFTGDKEGLFNRRKFWVHALGTAYIARALSRYTPEVIQKDAFVIGLLHDFGKVVLDQHFSKIFSGILTEAEKRKLPLHRVCYEITGTDHAEIGANVADNWNMPVQLVRSIRYHHSPELADSYDKGVHLAHLSNVFCHLYKIGMSGNVVPDKPNVVSLRALGIEGEDLDEIWKSLQIDQEHIMSILK